MIKIILLSKILYIINQKKYLDKIKTIQIYKILTN